MNTYNKEYYIKNRDRIKKARKKWYKKNRNTVIKKQLLKYYKSRNIEFKYTKKERQVKRKMQPLIVEKAGEVIIYHYIGELAKKLDRSSATIKGWEEKGWIPKTRYKDKVGRRLYTEKMIEAVVTACKSSGMLTGIPIKKTKFISMVKENFKAIGELE